MSVECVQTFWTSQEHSRLANDYTQGMEEKIDVGWISCLGGIVSSTIVVMAMINWARDRVALSDCLTLLILPCEGGMPRDIGHPNVEITKFKKQIFLHVTIVNKHKVRYLSRACYFRSWYL